MCFYGKLLITLLSSYISHCKKIYTNNKYARGIKKHFLTYVTPREPMGFLKKIQKIWSSRLAS